MYVYAFFFWILGNLKKKIVRVCVEEEEDGCSCVRAGGVKGKTTTLSPGQASPVWCRESRDMCIVFPLLVKLDIVEAFYTTAVCFKSPKTAFRVLCLCTCIKHDIIPRCVVLVCGVVIVNPPSRVMVRSP